MNEVVFFHMQFFAYVAGMNKDGHINCPHTCARVVPVVPRFAEVFLFYNVSSCAIPVS